VLAQKASEIVQEVKSLVQQRAEASLVVVRERLGVFVTRPRIALGSHMFVAPEFRLGWEPETRIAITIGMRFP
jgi:hypothetical protein